MALRVPVEPTYQFIPGDHAITYFLPEEVLQEKISRGEVSADILVDYPDGVEIYLMEKSMDRFRKKYRLNLNIDINAINQAYDNLKKARKIPKDGMIKASALEGLAKSSGNAPLDYKPKMSKGEDDEVFFARLTCPGKRA